MLVHISTQTHYSRARSTLQYLILTHNNLHNEEHDNVVVVPFCTGTDLLCNVYVQASYTTDALVVSIVWFQNYS